MYHLLFLAPPLGGRVVDTRQLNNRTGQDRCVCVCVCVCDRPFSRRCIFPSSLTAAMCWWLASVIPFPVEYACLFLTYCVHVQYSNTQNTAATYPWLFSRSNFLKTQKSICVGVNIIISNLILRKACRERKRTHYHLTFQVKT